MVFPEHRFKKKAPCFAFTVFVTVIGMMTSGCTSRGAKSVSVTCPPGQSTGADGKCQSAAPSSSPGPNDPNQTPTQEEPFFPPEEESPQEQDDNSLLPEGNQDETTEQPQTTPDNPFPDNPFPDSPTPISNPDPISPSPPSIQSPTGPQNPPGTIPNNQVTQADKINGVETVTTLFKDAPKTTTDGAPLLALKLITSTSYGKVARAAFSYTTGVTNAKYKYHKKIIRTNDTPFNSDGSLKVEIIGIPVSVSFDWNSKSCETEVIEVGFEAKTATATCK